MTAAQSSPNSTEASAVSDVDPSQSALTSTHASDEAKPKTVDAKRAKASAPKLKLHVAHKVPGRVRMKVSSAKGNSELLKQIGETFSVIPGIERITVNPTTGSVVLHYDTDRHNEFHNHLDRHCQTRGYSPPNTEIDVLARNIEDEAEFLAENSQTAKAVVDFLKKFDQEIRIASGNTIDLKIVLAVGVIGVTVLEIGASAATPVWLTLTVFGLNHVIEMHQPRRREATVGAPVVLKTR